MNQYKHPAHFICTPMMVALCLLLMTGPAVAAEPALTGDAYSYANQAYKALANGDAVAAEGYTRKAMQGQSNNPQLGLLLMSALIQQGKSDQAHKQADLLTTQWPKNAQIRAQRGFLFQHEKRCSEAIREFSLAADFGLSDTDQVKNTRLSWADCAVATNQPDEALKALYPLQSNSDFAVQSRLANLYANRANYASAQHALKLASTAANSDAERASVATLAKQISGKVHSYNHADQAITENILFPATPAQPVAQTVSGPNAPLAGDAYLYADQAYKALARKDASAAEGYTRKALALRSDSQKLGLLLINTQIQQGKLDQARTQADSMASRWPNNAQILAQRGYLLQKQQLFDQAMQSFSKAIRIGLASSEQERTVRIAWADSAFGLLKPSTALVVLAPFKADADFAIQSRIAQALISIKKFSDARHAIDLAAQAARTTDERATVAGLSDQLARQNRPAPTSINPPAVRAAPSASPVNNPNGPLNGDSFAYADQAYKALAQHDAAAAEDYTRKALSLRPNNQQLGLLLINTLSQQGKLNQARTQADVMASRWPNNAQILAQRGYLLQKQQLFNEAMQSFAKATQIGLASREQETTVRIAWADSAFSLFKPSTALAVLAPFKNTPDFAIQSRIAQALITRKNYAAARKAVDLASQSARTANDQSIVDKLSVQLAQQSRSAAAISPAVVAPSMNRSNDPNAPLSGDAFAYADQAYKALANGDAVSAERYTRQAMELRKNNPKLGLLLINTLVPQGKVNQARQQIDAMSARWPNDAQVHAQRGFILQKQQLYTQAIESFSKATIQGLSTASQEKQVRLAWADSALNLYKHDQVLAALAPYRSSNDYNVQYRIGKALIGQKNYAGASRALSIARQVAQTTNERAVVSGLAAQIPSARTVSPTRFIPSTGPVATSVLGDAPVFIKENGQVITTQAAAPFNRPVAFTRSPAKPVSANAPLSGDAFAYADQAYKALANGDTAGAERYTRRAMSLRPNNLKLGLLLLNALSAQGKMDAAAQQSELLLARFPGNAQILTQRGYLFQKMKRCDQAIPAFSQASAAGLPAKQDRFVRLAWADCAQSVNQSNNAITALNPLQGNMDYDVQYRMANIRVAQHDYARAKLAAARAQRSARTAKQRIDAGNLLTQITNSQTGATRSVAGTTIYTPATFVPYGSKNQPVYLAEQASNSQSISYNSATVADMTGLSANRSLKHVHLKKAYAAVADKNDVVGLSEFQLAFASGEGDARNYADAAFAAIRSGQNALARSMIKRALDLNATMPEERRYFDEETVYNYRRSLEAISRKSGLVANIYYQSNGFQPQSNNNVIQGGLEAYIQPDGSNFLTTDSLGYDNGRIMQFFIRGTATLYDKVNKITGAKTLQGALGMRYKPLSNWNIILGAERQFKIGKFAINDWLLRAGYSTGIGSDLRPQLNDWATWQLFAETAYYVRQRWALDNAELTLGKSFKSKKLLEPYRNHVTFYPHLVAAITHDNKQFIKNTVAMGAGLNTRYWFREDDYRAPPSYLELGLQYRYEFTKSGRAGGPVIRGTLWY